MKSILYPPTLDWNFLFQRPQQLMSQFALNNWKVHYINKTQRYKDVEEIKENLYLYHDFSIYLNRVKKVDVLYISSPRQHYICDKVKADIVIYDCVDKFIEWEKHEKKMLNRADIIFTTSQYLYDEKNKYHDHVFLIKNACDYDFFQGDYKTPIDLSRLKRPIIALIGALGNWIDRDILNYVAKKYTTILIGKEFGNNLGEGMINLASKSYNELPFYYNNIDLGLIPFDKSETSLAANPIKMYEYLAAGKAVVGSKLPELEAMNEVLYLADKPQKFVDEIEKALKEDCLSLREKRKKIASENTWEDRFEKIESIIRDYFA
ncbi:MAG: hypothetical protein ACQEQF_03895 [Bacillota bacterium]